MRKLLLLVLSTAAVASAGLYNPAGAFPTLFEIEGYNTRYLSVYGPTQFTGIDQIDIQEISIYSGGAPLGPFPSTTPDLKLYLSITSAVPTALSNTFADNLSAAEQLVFSGTAAGQGAIEGFTITLPLLAPFTYRPSDGALAFDARNGSAGFMFTYATGISSGQAAVGGGNADATGGFSGAMIIQLAGDITYTPPGGGPPGPSPEPSTLVLSAAALGLVAYRHATSRKSA